MEAYEKYEVGEILNLRAFDLGKDSNENYYLSLEGKSGEMLRVYTYPIKFEEEEFEMIVLIGFE